MIRTRGDWIAIALLTALVALCLPSLAAFVRAGGALVRDPVLRGDTLAGVSRWGELLANTAVVAGGAAALALPLALFASGVATRSRAPGRRLILPWAVLAACLPMWVTAVFIGTLIDYNRWFHNRWLCAGLYAALWTPLATLILARGWRMVQRDLEELALLDAGPARVLWRVTLPALRGAIAAAALVLLLLTTADNTFTDLMAVRTFAEESYTQFSLHFAGPTAVLTALPLIAALSVGLCAGARLLRPLIQAEASLAERRRPRHGERRTVDVLLSGAACVCVAPLLLVCAPLLVRAIGAPADFRSAAATLLPEIGNSLALASAAAVPLAIVAVGWAWLLLRGTDWSRRVAGAAVVLLLATPPTVTAISLIELVNQPGPIGDLRDSGIIVVVGYWLRFAPLAILLLAPSALRVPSELVQAGLVDGCGPARLLTRVVWPLCRRDAAIAGVILVLLCFGEVICTHLTAPPQWRTAAVRAFTLLHFGIYADLAVLGVLGMLVTAGLCGVLWWIVGRASVVRRGLAAGGQRSGS